MQIQRWVAQRITYCLRKTGGMNLIGKEGNALTYEIVRETFPAKRKKAGATKKRSRPESRAS